MTVTKRNSSPGRARRKPLKPLRREGRMIPATPVVPAACFFVARGPWVRRAPGLPCALVISRAAHAKDSGARRRENAHAFSGALSVIVRGHPSRRGLTATPQDEVFTRGAMSDPHGEEAHCAVSNHEARRYRFAMNSPYSDSQTKNPAA